jgi:hypothetical protein
MNRKTLLLVVLLSFNFSIAVKAQNTGEAMFVGFNSDGNSGFAFVTFVPIPTGTTLFFSDNEWNGSAIGSGGAFTDALEGAISWQNNTGTTLSAGSIITIDNSSTSPTASLGTITSGTITLQNASEVLYMYKGSNATTPTQFISAIANGGFSNVNGRLTNTGLTNGTNAIGFTGDQDVMTYSGSTNCTSTIAACATVIATTSNWIIEDGAGNQSNNSTAPDFPASVTTYFYGVVFESVTYYSRNATSGGAWNSNTSWTTISDGSGGPLAAGMWPASSDNVVILPGHTITINSISANHSAGISPDGLGRSNVGPFAASNLAMFYQTGDILIDGTLTVTGIEMMTEGYTNINSGKTFSLTSSYVNLGFLEANSSAVLSIADDLILAGNSSTIINTSAISNDDLIISFTSATLCGTGVATLQNGSGSTITYANGATVAQICTAFTVACSGSGCSGFPVTGTGATSLGNTGPGGIDKTDGTGNLEFWLDSRDVNGDKSTVTNGATISSWKDKSGNGVHVNQNIANIATYSTANGVVFNNTGYLVGSDATFPAGNAPRTAYVCAASPTTSQDDVLFFYGNDVGSQSYGVLKTAGGAIRNYFYGNDLDDSGGWLPANQTKIVTTRYASSFQEIFADGSSTATRTATPNTVINTDGVQVGGWSAFSLNSNASIKEVILLSSSINEARRIIIDNYLAAKYGTTLASNDVYTMDNSGNGNYDYEVAGIGQASDGSNHRDARGSGIVRVWNPGGLGNSEYLLLGHDNTALSSTGKVPGTDVDGTIIQERLSRIWRVGEQGDVGTVSISFDLSALAGTPLGSNLRLLIDRDGDGFADNDVTPVSGARISNTIVFSGVNFQNGDRFTLGNTDVLNSLPIELLYFNATLVGQEVKLDWSTATEVNNDFFRIEKSRNGNDWLTVGTLPGKGNSQVKSDYVYFDQTPYSGYSYYRLIQTDFDKRSSTSEVVRVLNDTESKWVISPNPSSGAFVISSSEELRPEAIYIVNSLGQSISFTTQPDPNGLLVHPAYTSSGVYIVQLKTRSGVRSVRLIKE